MKTITTFARITKDGQLRLDVSCGLSPGFAEVALVVQPTDTQLTTEYSPPYRSIRGIWAGKLPDIDVTIDIQDLNRKWKDGLEISES